MTLKQCRFEDCVEPARKGGVGYCSDHHHTCVTENGGVDCHRVTKERGILFQAPLVRAILAGKKSQTRRLIKPQPFRCDERVEHYAEFNADVRYPTGWRAKDLFVADESPVSFAEQLAEHCPYGPAGRRLWVRETWRRSANAEAADAAGMSWATIVGPSTEYAADLEKPGVGWRPSIFMPRHKSRITLEVTEVRVQRLQDITEEDAIAEGVEPLARIHASQAVAGENRGRTQVTHPYTLALAVLCDTINGDRASWASNPWVWCISFRRLENTK